VFDKFDLFASVLQTVLFLTAHRLFGFGLSLKLEKHAYCYCLFIEMKFIFGGPS
jgi:hypothetical protein